MDSMPFQPANKTYFTWEEVSGFSFCTSASSLLSLYSMPSYISSNLSGWSV